MGHEQRVEGVLAAFRQVFEREAAGVAEAPGRVNLIGEHVDYNDGLVLPFAIDRSVLVAWARRDDAQVRAYAVEYDEQVSFDLASIARDAAGSWANYIRGVADVVNGGGHALDGIDLAIAGDVPQGAGLSSSAAIEVAVAGAFRDAFALSIDDVELARLCQRAENEFVGMNCGIMDQFASVLSRRDHALLIDCRTLVYEAVPLRLAPAGLVVVIANSGVRRGLVGSAYNDRRRECEEAVAELRRLLGRPELTSLRGVTAEEIEGVAGDGASIAMRRARHVVTEIARVACAVEALGCDDLAGVGRLMHESHMSLRDDYEVSSRELDLLVGLAEAQEYVVGARLTGAGFGGCTVNLVRADRVQDFERDVIAAYRERTGLPAEMYVTSAQDGLRTWAVGGGK